MTNETTINLGGNGVIHQPDMPDGLRASKAYKAFDDARQSFCSLALKSGEIEAQFNKTSAEKSAEKKPLHEKTWDAVALAYDELARHQRRIDEEPDSDWSKREKKALEWAQRGVAQLHGHAILRTHWGMPELIAHCASTEARGRQAGHFRITPDMLTAARARAAAMARRA